MDVDVASTGIHAGLSKLLASGQFADMLITCQGREFKVHKAIVCSQSAVLLGAFKPGGFKESITGVIDLPDDEPATVEAMINFLYKFEITTPTNTAEAMPLLTSLFTLADKYDVVPLKHFIRQKFEKLCMTKETTHIIAAVKAVYSTEGTTELRCVVVEWAHKYLKAFLNDPGFEETMDEFGEFGKDIAKLHSAEPSPDQMMGFVRFECHTEMECELAFMVDIYEDYHDQQRSRGPILSIGDGCLCCECPRCGGSSPAVPETWHWSSGEPSSLDATWAKYTCNCVMNRAIYCDHDNQQQKFDENGALQLDCWFCCEPLKRQGNERD